MQIKQRESTWHSKCSVNISYCNHVRGWDVSGSYCGSVAGGDFFVSGAEKLCR